ncbi:MAG: Stp1/IreP family PP2C-type Ser/Thr phosphatase [Lachnospiraceae bacterium]|nr:Stp1/IreP family PP2C-type Ser/Thr phosphatase [Lachnospiraceae bacterium]
MISFGSTHVGQKRSINQDYIYFSDEPVGNLPNLYIVADGMGGHKAGDKASSFAVEEFVKYVEESEDEHPLVLMKSAMDSVNEALFHLAVSKPEYEGMGTTFVAAVILDDSMYIMNIGDSRLYILEDNLIQISMDHSLVEELVRNGQLTKEEARNHPQKNVITRAVGVDTKVKADFFQVSMEEVRSVLLCSDGLTNMITEQTMKYVLENTKSIRKAAEALIGLANDNGGLDNISVVIIEKEER